MISSPDSLQRVLVVMERIEKLRMDDATSGDVYNLSEMIVDALDEYDRQHPRNP